MKDYKILVSDWAKNGFDLEAGISLFLSYNNNVFYMNNVRSKPYAEAIATLKSELFFKSGIRVDEQDALYAAVVSAREGKQAEEAHIASDPVLLARRQEEERTAIAKQEHRVRLRDEFSFLNRADCPDEYEDILQEMITMYYRYKKKHLLLFRVPPEDVKVCFTAGRDVVESYLRNRLCWKELNYYKVHGKVLGEHPIFTERKRKIELEGMSTVDLTLLKTNGITRNMSYYRNTLKRHPDSKKADSWRKKLLELENEREWITTILLERGEL